MRAAMRPATSPATLASASTRRVAVHFCPASAVPHATMHSAARSRSASPSTTAGLIPPSSSATRANRGAATAASARPAASEPVKWTAATRSSAASAPAVAAAPGTTRQHVGRDAGGVEQVARAIATAVARSDGFQTTALPATNAGSHFQAGVTSGTFHGVIAATTPTGRRVTRAPADPLLARRVIGVVAGGQRRPRDLAIGVDLPLPDLAHEQLGEPRRVRLDRVRERAQRFGAPLDGQRGPLRLRRPRARPTAARASPAGAEKIRSPV